MSNHIPAPSRYRVAARGGLRVAALSTKPPASAPDKEACKARLAQLVAQIAELQDVLYANDHRALLLIFQGIDASGKDSTIRHVFSGVNPAGCQVKSFKQPSEHELDHDFLWRTTQALPDRGCIGVFNRSYYEEVLTVRVHPEGLRNQRLPEVATTRKQLHSLWAERYESIRHHERHLVRSGTVVLKFWLNISREEQRRRFLARLEQPEKHWKFSADDLGERALWPQYMAAFQDALNATSRSWAPWYAIPADDKPYARMAVAEIVLATLRRMRLSYPRLDLAQQRRFARLRRQLRTEMS